ncbi:MAG: class I SAM-dependent methyltransferase [Patescibacteria group bacterium]|jgi:SAM-dependent methyltransferase
MKNELLQQATQSVHWENRESLAFEFILLIKKIIGDLSGKTFLDIGCAKGRDCEIFQKEGLDPIGIDNNPNLIGDAKTQYPDIEFICGDAALMPFENERFDIVYGTNILFYLDLDVVLREAFRVLKNGGYGVFSFDAYIIHLDRGEVFHEDSLDHLELVVRDLDGKVVHVGSQETRLDAVPFKHKHEFYKVIVQKN